MAKYMLGEPFYFLLPRLLPSEVRKLDQSRKKEWLVLRNDDKGALITLADLEGVENQLKRKILALKDHPLGGSKEGGRDKIKWNALMQELKGKIRSGEIRIRHND